jgi:cytochrome c553
VKGGAGKTVACEICHGPDSRDWPRCRELPDSIRSIWCVSCISFRTGRMVAPGRHFMKAPVAKLTDDDILSIAAYVRSLA